MLAIFRSIVAVGCILAWSCGAFDQRSVAQESKQESKHATASPKTLQSNELTESSGVAQVGELLWTHNDSGDQPRLFAFAMDGSLRGLFQIRGAQALDWEDICAFTRDGKHYLAVGDVGDNQAQRSKVSIYVIEVPRELPVREPLAGAGQLEVQATFEVTYSTGPVNCEALAYDPLSREFLLATKELTQCRLFRVPAAQLSGVQRVQAELIGGLRLPLVTAGDISPDGKQLVLATYGPGCLLQREAASSRAGQSRTGQGGAGESTRAGWQTEGDQAALIFEVPSRRQGESICFSEDGRRLWLTSELLPTPLLEIPVPDRKPQ